MQLYGRTWTRRELEARAGRLEQLGGIRRLKLTEGLEDGVEQIQVRTGAGLSYYVTPHRCLDISLAEFGGAPFSWQGVNGDVHPAYYDFRGMEWLRTAAGGLLMTCGFTQVGVPCVDNGKELGLHGRAHHLPARHVVAEGRWQGDEYEMRVAGVIEEAVIFGEHVRLTREIRSRLGENRIAIRDVVENIGFEPVPHMILYHFNLGFPLMCEDTRLTFPSRRVLPRYPSVPMEGYDRYQAPTVGYQERVYFHEDLATQDGKAAALVENPRFPLPGGAACSLTLAVTWATDTLQRMIEWKMPGTEVYVLGVEPTNCYAGGRVDERERGTLVMLKPGQALTYDLELALTQRDVVGG
jgi:hypothetical protein